MAGRTVPAGTVIETDAGVIDARLLEAVEAPASRYGGQRYDGSDGGYGPDPRVAALAEFWVAGLPRGGAQVTAVVHALRRAYVHDRSAAPPAECRDAVADFLLRSCRGPDYLFASSAVVLLRSLGYPARLAGGLYASPRRYDPRARHTPVLTRDAHVWAEVQLPGGTWVAIEPTPGYRLPVPSPGLAGRLAALLKAAGRAARDHAAGLVAGLLALAAAARFRRELLDRLATLAWRSRVGQPWHRLVLATLALVEHRSRWAGRPRPSGLTPARWYGPIAAAAAPGPCADMDRLVRLADWALYAPQGVSPAPPWAEPDIRSTCRRVAQSWTLGQFRVSAAAPRCEKGPRTDD